MIKQIPDDFARLFPTTSNNELSEIFNVSRSAIQRWSKKLQLEKTPDYKCEVQRKRATGRILSEESKDKIRQKSIGRKASDITKRKALETKQINGSIPKGDKHYAWKGGKPWERFKNPEYLAWRTAVLERDDYTCNACNRKCNKGEKGLAAHHIKPYSKFPDLRFSIDNGITLCRKCHMELHGKSFTIQQIECACGCGTLINSKDKYGRPRKFVNHHAKRTLSEICD